MERIAEPAPGPNARRIGVVYLLFFLLAFLGGFLTRGLVVPGNAAATAANILAHETLYRSGFAIELITYVLYIAVTALFYVLFRPVNRSLSLLAAFLSLTGCGIQLGGGLLQLVPLVIAREPQLMSAFSPAQLQATALLSLKLYSQVFSISLVLFAFFDLIIGYLIVRSTFLPRILGVLMMLAGVGWLTYLWPPLAASVSVVVQPFGGLAEILLMLWLLVKGVDAARWQERAGAAAVARA